MASFSCGRRGAPSKGRTRFIPQDRRTKPVKAKPIERRHRRDEDQIEAVTERKSLKERQPVAETQDVAPIIRVNGALRVPIERTEEDIAAEAQVAEAMYGRP